MDRLSDYDYDLPPEAIAQRPAAGRDTSRLLVADPVAGRLEDRVFSDLTDLLGPESLLVVNDSRVIPARLFGQRVFEGGAPDEGPPARFEVFVLTGAELDGQASLSRPVECLIRPAKRVRKGALVAFGPDFSGRVAQVLGGGRFLVRFSAGAGLLSALDAYGKTPLPPYIRRQAGDPDEKDRRRYQTVYADRPGSVAAPTAGLHFTEELLTRLEARGVGVVKLTLHVGWGTFAPIRSERLSEHRMEAEFFDIHPDNAAAINAARRRGKKIVAVGTTSVRALETAVGEDGRVAPGQSRSELFIRQGYRFRAVDAMITNFHLPRSTLLALVSAFAGREFILEAYRHAAKAGYRFYSYGDAMFISGRGGGARA